MSAGGAAAPAARRDALLVVARVLTVVLEVAFWIGLGGLAIGTVAVLAVQGDVAAEIAKEGFAGDAAQAPWLIAGLMVLAVVPVALMIRFVQVLRALIATVDAGDPFVPANADRLARMGWLALAVQAVAIPLGALGFWFGRQFKEGGRDFDLDVALSGNGLVLVLMLFILSRIFRHGAAMRAELEATV